MMTLFWPGMVHSGASQALLENLSVMSRPLHINQPHSSLVTPPLSDFPMCERRGVEEVGAGMVRWDELRQQLELTEIKADS